MDTEELRAELKRMISELIEIDDFGDDEDFVQDLGVDSMMGLEVVAQIEKRYQIRIPEEKLREIKTMNDVVVVTSAAIESAA